MNETPRHQDTKKTPEIILALDVSSLERVGYFVDILYPQVKIFKVGSQLFTACGPEAVKIIGRKGAKVFLDLKFHDIPRTVFSAVVSGTGISCEPVFVSPQTSNIKDSVRDAVQFPVVMMTVHATGTGGRAMLESAVEGAKEKAKELNIPKPFIIGVTRLTSDENNKNTQKEVLAAAKLAKDAGLDGIVCSVHEARIVRKGCGEDFIIVTPGIRLHKVDNDDQKRTATAAEAIKAGSDFLVVGSPILKATDPLKVVQEIISRATKTKES